MVMTRAAERGRPPGLLASILLGAFGAHLAVHLAAPVELAVALPGPRELVGVVAAPAAHEVTAVRSYNNGPI